MWNRPSNWKWIAASVLALPAFHSFGADLDAPATATDDKNKLSLRARIGLNYDARFSQSGTIKPPQPIGGTGSALDHYYEDGYVRVDISGNAGGQTWFWGYNGANQISGNNILFHSTSSTAASSPKDISNGPQPGLELVYNREFGAFGKQQQHHWGLEASLGWNSIRISDNGAAQANVSRVTDAFAYTPGTTPPSAPFRGTFEGPNFSISDTPVRTIQNISGVQVTGSREFDGDLIVGHLGPYADFELANKLHLTVSGGLAIGGMLSQFSWNETVQVPGASALKRHASGSDGDMLIGGFIGTQLEYQFKPTWNLQVGFLFESLSDYSQTVAGHKATIDLSTSFNFTFGIGHTF